MSKIEAMLKTAKYLRYAQLFFYVAFLFLWFKDNFYTLKKIDISYLIPLIFLIAILLVRLFINFRTKKIRLPLVSNKTFIALMVLIIIVTAFRIPFLVYNHSLEKKPDSGVSALMGKHISEGKVPPIFWYGQLRLGSLLQHLYALFFRIFGYSIFLLRFIPFLIFLAFLTIQFILLKEIFSLGFSFIACLFYSMPVTHLGDWLSIDAASGFSLVLFFGALILQLTYLIYFKDKENLLPVLGFLMGLAFWTHQITIGFILSSFIILTIRLKFQWKKYLNLFLMIFIGCFPLLLSEIFNKFILTKYLFLGGKGTINPANFKKTGGMIIDLIFHNSHPLTYSFLILILFGLGSIIFLSSKHHKFLPQNIYVIFFMTFSLIYFISNPSGQAIIHRYLFPLYVVLPVLLISVFDLIKKKIKYVIMFSVFLFVFILNNLNGVYSDILNSREHHRRFKKVISGLRDTNIKYWQSRYIRSYLLTALSKEDVIVSSTTLRKYFPYKLYYYQNKKYSNYIFLVNPEGGEEKEQANNLLRLLQRFDLKYKLKKIDFWWLVYDIEAEIFPRLLKAQVPEEIPELYLMKQKTSKARLKLVFRSNIIPKTSGFRLHVEIPGYSSRVKSLPLAKKTLTTDIPFPKQKDFTIKYYLDYWGTHIKSSEKAFGLSIPESRLILRKIQGRNIVYLSGFGPRRTILGKERTICGKEISLKIDKSLKKNEKIWLFVYSPFAFQAYPWYGDYIQKVLVFQNDEYLTEKELKDGENIISFNLNPHPKNKEKIIVLKFQYSLPFDFARTWKTSALLEKVEIR